MQVEVDFDYSSCKTLGGRTDFDKIGFTVVTEAGKRASVYADRCGGTRAEAVVTDAEGNEVFRSVCPDEAQQKAFEVAAEAHPDWMPYFLLQHDDYVTLKVGPSSTAALEGVTPKTPPPSPRAGGREVLICYHCCDRV